jgi:hypothetical protein
VVLIGTLANQYFLFGFRQFGHTVSMRKVGALRTSPSARAYCLFVVVMPCNTCDPVVILAFFPQVLGMFGLRKNAKYLGWHPCQVRQVVSQLGVLPNVFHTNRL